MLYVGRTAAQETLNGTARPPYGVYQYETVYCTLYYHSTVTLIAAQSWSTLATGGLSLFNFYMSVFYMLFTSAFAVAVVVD